ncbi:MAG: peptidase S41, partial [Microcoleaceae cyanobacterium]
MVQVKRGLILGATAVMLTSVAVVGAGIHLTGQASLSDNNQKNLIDEVWQIIDKTYVDGTFNQVDWQGIRKEYLNRSYTNNQQAYDAIKEMLGKLDDPYTRFMEPEEFKNMQIDTSGELTGVGIQLSQDEKTKKLIVIAPI